MTSFKSPRILRIAALSLSITAILMVFVLGPSSEKIDVGAGHSKATIRPHDSQRASTTQPYRAQAASVRPRREALPRPAPVITYPAIGELLTNDQLSHDDTARQLAAMALNSGLPEAERLEAMEHAKNLGFAHLLPLALDPNLPFPIAESLLQGLHGHQVAKDQVTGALGLMNHLDTDIREQAQTFLGFLLGAEEDNESPEKLREKADVFLKQPAEGDGQISGQ